ncbi:intradiol ring-cleavage dioxygenase [bacterium]|nr:intradiol ring-cleavage dioxygenase [bacterium]
MKSYLIALVIILCITTCAKSQSSKKVGGPCQGCEAALDYGEKKLSSVDTLPGFNKHDQKMKIQGTVFKKDGKTPAENVIIYIYQTNQEGIYEKKGGETGFASYHGIYRGWVKTNDKGYYAFYTFKPGSYPSRSQPAHVHFTIKEPDKNEYYIDAIEFADDPLLSKAERNRKNPRGGNGIITLVKRNGLLIAERDIILGLNIPNYE